MNNMAGEKKKKKKYLNTSPQCFSVCFTREDFSDLQAVVLGSQKELHQVEQPVTVRKKVRTRSERA